jgi:O-methyltransferase involved in polyketide biosynthesis
MPRTHDDSWDLASSVGATATLIAACRAMATKDPRGLINDLFAEPLVRAVGLELPSPDDDEPPGEIIYVSGTLAG